MVKLVKLDAGMDLARGERCDSVKHEALGSRLLEKNSKWFDLSIVLF